MIELDRLLVGPGVERGLELLAATGLLRFMLPELELQVDIDVDDDARSLFDHTVEAVVGARRRHRALGRAAARRRGALRRADGPGAG